MVEHQTTNLVVTGSNPVRHSLILLSLLLCVCVDDQHALCVLVLD